MGDRTQIYVDGVLVARLSAGQSTTVYVTAGQHRFGARAWGVGGTGDPTYLTVESGGYVPHLRVVPGRWRWIIELTPPESRESARTLQRNP